IGVKFLYELSSVVVDIVGFCKIRISVSDKHGITLISKAAHTAVGSSFDPELDPEILIRENHLQHFQSSGILESLIHEIACAGNIAHASCRGKSLISPAARHSDPGSSL